MKPVLHILKERVLSVSDDDTALTADIKTQMLDYMESMYSGSDLHGILNVACFVDPQFRMDYIDSDTAVSIVKDCLCRESIGIVPEES